MSNDTSNGSTRPPPSTRTSSSSTTRCAPGTPRATRSRSRTNRTRLVPHPVPTGHVSSLTPYQPDTSRPSPRTNRTRRVPHPDQLAAQPQALLALALPGPSARPPGPPRARAAAARGTGRAALFFVRAWTRVRAFVPRVGASMSQAVSGPAGFERGAAFARRLRGYPPPPPFPFPLHIPLPYQRCAPLPLPGRIREMLDQSGRTGGY
jgi:hypothetical protein